ncbi:hypothetical protein AOC36_06470 [Erysipelothrix larvae]|uniref:Uncharacterized protein n=1 Tax=Erysipelothrix larvae TaxID=1514105 RepID=A0A0X8H063_9FIRM|nr:hypothetical protein [Erysipelothrix larvae]AMC93642.1 hypothetical protein AOC36_06470 [Erysipelothrix larvae]
MLKAFDSVLQISVFADSVEDNSDYEPLRYECLHCGEEVKIAAADSSSMVAHFRHRNGNNDIECEKYLGHLDNSKLVHLFPKKKKIKCDFYYNNFNKSFYFGVTFSDEEISKFEKERSHLIIYNHYNKSQKKKVAINHTFFSPNSVAKIEVDFFSNQYELSNPYYNYSDVKKIFNSNSRPTFFKMLGDEPKYKAKLVLSKTLYTNIPYFITYQELYSSPMDINYPQEIKTPMLPTYFRTLDRNFIGRVVRFTKRSQEVMNLIRSWGYELEDSETLTLLWPPAINQNNKYLVNTNFSYLYSSFDLKFRRNINIDEDNIRRHEKGITRVCFDSDLRINSKNIDVVLATHQDTSTDFDQITFSKHEASIFKVPSFTGSESYHLFNSSGVHKLNSGQKVILTKGSTIKCYSGNRLCGVVYPRQRLVNSKKLILADILKYYKRTECIRDGEFDGFEICEEAKKYVYGCYEKKQINTVVKQYILEGKL